MVLTSGLGALFWWAAARLFTPDAVGIAAGSVAAMVFLGSLAMVGTGTLLLRELPRAPGQERAMVSTAASVALVIAASLGALYAIAAPLINPELRAIAESPAAIALFTLGVMLTVATLLADYVLLAMLRATLRFMRSALFATSKLVLLLPAALLLGASSHQSIYGVWILGSIASLALVAVFYRHSLRPKIELGLVPAYARPALMHYSLSMAIAFPALAIPVIVALMSSPTEAAQFYVAWMLASVAFYPSVALSQSLFALAGRAPHQLWHYARTTMILSFGAGILATAGAIVLGGAVLGLFGEAYRADAAALPVFVAVAIPQTVKDHYQTISRLHGGFSRAVLLCGVGGAVEAVAAVIGFAAAGAIGLAAAWLVAVTAEASLMAPLTLRAARRAIPPA
jgi:O-antigen/teichoic acid export membrane protein